MAAHQIKLRSVLPFWCSLNTERAPWKIYAAWIHHQETDGVNLKQKPIKYSRMLLATYVSYGIPFDDLILFFKQFLNEITQRNQATVLILWIRNRLRLFINFCYFRSHLHLQRKEEFQLGRCFTSSLSAYFRARSYDIFYCLTCSRNSRRRNFYH